MTINRQTAMGKIVFTIIITAIMASSSFSAELQVDKDKDNKVIFYSDAPLEDIEGVTDNIDGYVYWPEDRLSSNIDYEKSEFHFEVKLETIDTGIGLRNRHMRENYLETDQFPFAEYTGKLVTVIELENGGFIIKSSGAFEVHGKSKKLDLEISVNGTDKGYLVNSQFTINLNDYEIEVPKLMFMKVSEQVDIDLSFNLKSSH